MLNKIKNILQNRINARNRNRLTNNKPTLICSNCTGGFLYHWLGLRFYSPFINLYMEDNDFVTALENWEQFLKTPIDEIKNSGYDYPVGKGFNGVIIHFMHYENFNTAILKWNERKNRINNHNIGFMLTNWGGDESLLYRFDNLPFKHKVVFTDRKYINIKTAYYIKGFKNVKGLKNIYATQYINGKRYIDQFDYVSFINQLPINTNNK